MSLELNNAAETATIPVKASATGAMMVQMEAGAANIGAVDTRTGKQASDTITLAHDVAAHHALDVVSTAAGEILEFASLGAANDLICILGARLKYNGSAVPSASTGYRLHLYNASPTAIADDAAFNVPSTDLVKYIGYIPLSVLVDNGDTCISWDNNINFTAKLTGTGLYGILQCIAAETPAANAVFTILLNTVAI